MTRARHVLLLLLAPLAFGCATAPAGSAQDPEQQLAFGLAALERQDFGAAYDHLVWVYTNYWDRPVGQRALLALSAAELDPRNPNRRLGEGSRLAAGYLQLVPQSRWVDPAASTMYLLALELGAAEQRATEAEAERQAAVAAAMQAQAAARQAEQSARRAQAQARAAGGAPAPPARDLPTLPGPPVTAQMRQLQQRINQLEREVAERDQELERMRRALRN